MIDMDRLAMAMLLWTHIVGQWFKKFLILIGFLNPDGTGCYVRVIIYMLAAALSIAFILEILPGMRYG